MREFRRIGDGTNGASWFENVLAQITLILGFYVFPYILSGCLAVLALLYLVIWVSAGFSVVFWTTVLVYVVLLGGSVGLWYLVQNPQLSWFQKLPFLYQAVQKLDWVFGWLRRFHGMLFIEAKRITPILVKKKKQLALWAGSKFWALPLKTKLAVTGVVVLTLVPAMLLVSVKTVQTVQSKWPYGANRSTMTSEELAVRKENRINHALWAVWGKQNSKDNAKCMDQYRDLIWAEAARNSLTPERFEAQMFVEAMCKTDQINQISGAAGFTQLMLDVGCEEGLVMDKTFCKQVLKPGSKIKFIPKEKKIEDRRLDPKFAIPTAAKILGKAAKYWGDENWSYVQYHMGVGNLRNLVMDYLDETRPGWRANFPANFSNTSDPNRSIPQAIALYGISYDDIFFRCNPKTTPKTYRRLYKMSDDSATYVYTGLAALKGLNLMRTDYPAFEQMVSEQQDPDGGLSNRPMRAWWSDKDAKYKNLADIIAATNRGELVSVKNDPSFGFVLRTSGPSRIAQCDSGNEEKYYVTRKATAGMIYFIAAKTKELGAEPLEITGLVRTHWMYDGIKCLPDTQPRTHVIGVAFDIGAMINGKPMSSKTKQALIFVIRDLRADGLIDRIDESSADHIVYNPEFEQFFESIYDDVMSGSSPLVVR